MNFEDLLVEKLAVKCVDIVRTLMAQAVEKTAYLEPNADRVIGISDEASASPCSDESGVQS